MRNVWLYIMMATFIGKPLAHAAEPSTQAARGVAANTSGTDAVLGSAWQDASVTLRAENIKTFGGTAFSNPLEKLQLRLNQNEYIEDRKAILRASPRGIGEYRLLRQLNLQAGHLEEMTYRESITKALVARYMALIDYRFAFENRRVTASLAQNARRAMSMQSASAKGSKSSAHDLLRAREGVQTTQFKLAEAELKLRSAGERLKALNPALKLESISFADWPAPSELSSVAGRFSTQSSSGGNLETMLAHEHANRMRDSIEYDRQRDTKIIDYVELSYSEKAAKDSTVGFEIGINIPGFSGKEFSDQEKARQAVRYEIDARDKEREQQLLQTESREALARAVEAYRFSTSAEDNATESRIRALARTADPILANAIDHDTMAREQRGFESAREAYMAYVELLRASGVIDEKARTNFLSRVLKEIRL